MNLAIQIFEFINAEIDEFFPNADLFASKWRKAINEPGNSNFESTSQ